MRAWTVDADDIRVAEDFDESLLHRTPEIDSFLAPDRDDKFILIGTKGFGKTLLLKAKRILYQREGRAVCLPSGSLLDKPIGDKIFSRETLAFFAASPLPWSKVWLAAIALAVLKHFDATDGLKVNARLAGLIRDAQLHGVIDHFVRLLDFTPSELQRSAADIDGHLVPRMRALKSPITIFIDGIDEYFNKHVEDRPTSASVTGELSPNVWYFAQLGLVEVAYQLRRVNHHLKVFAAIRKEAYASLPRRTAMAQQYRGSAVDIVYSPESLREIFVNNVRLVKADRMVLPARARANPLEAFLGRVCVTDTYTREEEDALEYVCRHTLLRPRDLMTIGERLAALRPDERRHEHRLKEAVNQAATEIAHEYLAEIAPYVGDLDLERLLQRLPGHILTRAEVEALDGEQESGGGKQVLWALYRVGLLGYVQHDRGARRVAPALSAPRRGRARPGRRLAAGHTLSGAPGPVRRDREAESSLPAARRPGQCRRLRPPLARHGPECRFCGACATVLRAQGRCARLRHPDALRHGWAGQEGARGGGAPLGAGNGDHRDRRRRRGTYCRRRSDRAGADGAAHHRRRVPGAGPAAAARGPALRRRAALKASLLM